MIQMIILKVTFRGGVFLSFAETNAIIYTNNIKQQKETNK